MLRFAIIYERYEIKVLLLILRRPGSHAKYFVLPDFDTGKKGFVVDEKDTCIFF